MKEMIAREKPRITAFETSNTCIGVIVNNKMYNKINKIKISKFMTTLRKVRLENNKYT